MISFTDNPRQISVDRHAAYANVLLKADPDSAPKLLPVEVNNLHFQAVLLLTPELKDQELVVFQSTGNSYWEGAVSIQGQSSGREVHGEGYVELT